MRRIFKKIIGFAAFLLGLILCTGLAVAALFIHGNSPPAFFPNSWERDGIMLEQLGMDAAVIRFEVRRGESAQSVGQRLADAGIIRNRYVWSILCRIEKEFIKNGSYRIELPSSQIAIHQLLVSGRQMLLRVTIPEGLTLKKTARLLEEAGICPADDFLAAAAAPETVAHYRIPGTTMEGYLYPETYFFPPVYPAAKVVQTMADTFFSRIGDISGSTLTMSPEALNRLVILASIVEREYRLPEEAPVMAGVFSNRLRIGMALQSCATVEYVITEIQGRPHPEFLTTRDIEIRDPYNTYVRPGLPPGPISNPGAVALSAVLSPTASNYLYFRLIDPASGKHYFSRTLDDHIQAGRLYLKGSTR
ncbi:MAG: endolytic transglycosylase MltG [Treponema sp.]|nr:endolytic transglycosylase MltG [Treponema sp.]